MIGKLIVLVIAVLIAYSFLPQDDKLDTLKDKRVLITGASTGIGEQIAYHYARLGSKVVVTSRRLDVLQKVAKRCQELSPQKHTHYAVAGDMADMGAAENVVKQAISKLGGLDIIVINHLIPPGIRTFTGSKENLTTFDHHLNINYRSYIHLAAHAFQEIVDNQGSIIVVNSLVGKVPHHLLAAYSSFKHGLHGFFNALRSQLIRENKHVTITTCSLGLIGTENALQQMKVNGLEDASKGISPASPDDTALAIVTAGARGDVELYYPYWYVKPTILFRSLFPETMDAFMRNMGP